MGYTTNIDWETLRSIDSTTFTGLYQALGTPLVNASYKLKMVNNSNVTVTVSRDGVNDIDICPAGGFWLYDATQTHRYEMMSAHTQLYVKGAAAMANDGFVYLVSLFLVVG